MIGWDKLEKELKKNNLLDIIQIFEDFYEVFQNIYTNEMDSLMRAS